MTTHTLFALWFAPAGQDGGGGMFIFVGQIALFIAIFYFLLIRPQRRQQEQHRQLLASLQRGDQVVTSGGVIGEVIHIKDDQVTIRSGESRFVVVRSGISSVTNRTAPGEVKGETRTEAKAK
jgi:preprotein translocase subunit YajC